jgi:PAS domain S-box-containing protein
MSFILKSIALIIVYLVAAKISLTFGTINHSATIFWPPGGIALAAVLLGGKNYLPAVFISACLAGYIIDAPLIFVFGAAFGNVLETYLGYSLLKRSATFNYKLYRLNDLVIIFVLGAMIPAIASSILGPLTLLASGLIHAGILPNIMWNWWKGDVLGIVFFTPLILVFTTKTPFFRDLARLLEIIVLWTASIALGQVIFLGWTPVVILEHTPNLAWLFPSIMWAGLRTGKRNTALIQLLFLSQSLASAYLNVGIFGDDFTRYGLSNFWVFAMFLAVLGMALAIMSAFERHSARINKQHAKLFEIMHEGVMIVDAQNIIVSVNVAFTNITGYREEEVVGKNPRVLSSGRQNREFYTDMWNTLIELGHWQGEVWNRRNNGEIYPEQITITAVKDASGIVTNYVATVIDITDRRYQEQQRLAHEVALRQALVREVHHRIKNSLHGVTGLLQRFVVQYPELEFPISKAISQVQSISVVHGLHGRDAGSCILFCEVIRDIAANHQFLWPAGILIDIPPNWIPCQISEENEVPLALVINELVLNALKHGASGECISISLRLDLQQDVVILTITNSGQLSHDVDFPNTPEKGIGLDLVMSLMPEKGATLTWEQRDGAVITRLAVTQPTITIRPDKEYHYEKL